jgi:CheY-like chemotaxis protein
LIEIDSGWESAAAAALGSLADAVVVQDLSSAVTALTTLRSENLGQADVLVYEPGQTGNGNIPTGLTPLSAHIRSSSIGDLLASLLASTVVAENANAAEAIAVLSSQTHVDLVFSDITMPGELDGVGLARWIADRRGEIPVLMTSGAAVLDGSGPISRLPFVCKPYGLEDIEERIRQLLTQ